MKTVGQALPRIMRALTYSEYAEAAEGILSLQSPAEVAYATAVVFDGLVRAKAAPLTEELRLAAEMQSTTLRRCAQEAGQGSPRNRTA